MKFIPHDYQKRAIDMVERLSHVGLFLDMGLGKTVITLTAVNDLMYDYFEIRKVLVIAPLRVAEDTWSRESKKWDHLNGLTISKILGTAAQRKAAVEAEADIYVVNRENVVWLTKNCKKWDFDMIVIDELSSFKNPQSKRFRALRKVIPKSSRVVGLTGTPSPNSLMDLWAQIYLLDRGERLGQTLSAYREEFFTPGAHNGCVVYKWNLRKGGLQEIEKRISDICISMSAKDYLTLPKRIDNEIPIRLSEEELALYKNMEREQLLHLGEDSDIVALNAAAVMAKLLQIANGSVYDTDGRAINIHQRKTEALQDIVEDTDSPVLVFYSFRHDLEAILTSVPDAKELKSPKDIKDWNSGNIRVLLAHPASVGYGLNLQEGGHTIVWYGLTWSLELYQQANARLYRQGQEKPVIVHHLIAEGTVDEQVMKALQTKDTSQAALLAALKERLYS